VLSAFPQGNTTGNLQKLAQVIPMKITFAAPKNLTHPRHERHGQIHQN
jgi:multidrug resistance efflux pump